MASDSFAQRVRALLDARKMTLAELAASAELDASLVSRLLSETENTRREPRLEHCLAIARVLEMAPRELVGGTSAEPLLGEWIPRGELEAESKLRSEAQTDAATLRTDLAGARGEVAALKAAVEQVSAELAAAVRRHADTEAASRRELTTLRVGKDAAESKLASAIAERDQALALAAQNYTAWANARSQILQLQREVASANGTAAAGWITALVGTIGGAILGAAAAEPARPARRRA
jgi:transcriptional regulator with XRE-family HTH domain